MSPKMFAYERKLRQKYLSLISIELATEHIKGHYLLHRTQIHLFQLQLDQRLYLMFDDLVFIQNRNKFQEEYGLPVSKAM
jgi:hypothetical protein